MARDPSTLCLCLCTQRYPAAESGQESAVGRELLSYSKLLVKVIYFKYFKG